LGLPLWRVGSWPFAVAALHDLRCVQSVFAGSQDVSPARAHRPFGPGTSRTSPQRADVWEVSFSFTIARGLSAASPVRPLHSAPPLPASLPLLGCPKITSPSVDCAGVLPQHLSVPSRRGLPRALARPTFVPTSPFSRPRRLAPPARYRACARPRSWGSPRFPRLRLSPPPRSPPRVSALRSLALRSSLRPSLTRWSRRFVSRRCRRFTEPLPSSFLPAALSRTRRNLEGFLVLRSRTPVRRFQRRSAVAPVGLSIL